MSSNYPRHNPSSMYGASDKPFSISGNEQYNSGAGSARLQHAQLQVDQVTNIMRENMAKALQRDTKLSEMDERATDLQLGAQQFQTTAHKVQRKFWWKNIKMWIILIAVVTVIIVIISVAIYFSLPSNAPNSNSPSGKATSKP